MSLYIFTGLFSAQVFYPVYCCYVAYLANLQTFGFYGQLLLNFRHQLLNFCLLLDTELLVNIFFFRYKTAAY